jgi:two-component system OmpR family response regulator
MAERHILAVDDDPTMREFVCGLLDQPRLSGHHRFGWRRHGPHPREGLVDVVVLDLKLAEEDGLQLVNEPRTRSNLPIIVITGHWHDEVDRIVGPRTWS